MEQLQQCTYQNTPIFSLEGQTVRAKCIDIYDGDSATFAIMVHGTVYKFKCRLSGIDTPEIRPSRSNPNRDHEKKAAKYVRNRFLQLVTGAAVDLHHDYPKKEIKQMLSSSTKLVWLKCGKFGKFGRCLIKVFLEESDLPDKMASVNKILLGEELAYKYYGGKKNDDFTTYFKVF